MARYVALLRGINVGGHAKVAMADLRALIADAGHTDIATYIQSGNAVFSDAKPAGRSAKARAARDADLEADLEGRLASELGLDIVVMVRSQAELTAVLDANPFATGEAERTYVMFAKETPAADLGGLDLARFAPEEVAVRDRQLYLRYPNGLGNAKLTTARLEKAAGTPGTARNWRTTLKLAEMLVDR
jgi:uncharacterized protein (DUF1697 family)